MHKLVTAEGFEFNAQSFIRVGDKEYDLDEMTEEQQVQIGAHLRMRFLNTWYAGKLEFTAPGLPPVSEIVKGMKPVETEP